MSVESAADAAADEERQLLGSERQDEEKAGFGIMSVLALSVQDIRAYATSRHICDRRHVS